MLFGLALCYLLLRLIICLREDSEEKLASPRPVKIAAIADTHYAAGEISSCGKRRCAISDILLLRAVHRLNRFIKPDVTLLLGDLIDDPDGPNAHEELEHIRSITGLLQSHVIAIPGNHDGDVERFYGVFPRPEPVTDIRGVRFVTFIDPEEPGYNARRTDEDLKLMASARSGWDGPMISVQHVPLFAPGSSPSRYSLVNAESVWGEFQRGGYTLAISGHYHPGDDMVERGAGPAVIPPALCESPFAFAEITIDGDRVETRRHELRMPPQLGLIDCHVHTPFAYCQQNMDMSVTMALAEEMGLAGLCFTEHSGQLYYDDRTFWSAAFMPRGIETTEGRQDRMGDYLEQARRYCPPAYLGFEIDCDYSGNPVIRPEDLAHAQVRIGAVHWLEELRKPEPDMRLAGREMLRRLETFLASGLDILAHPFRAFRRSKSPLPVEIVPEMVALLKRHNVAAEINFHTQQPMPELIAACVDAGVKLTLGSDSHNLYEVGEFWPHLELLHSMGYADSDLKDIMADPRPMEVQR